jgi:hypothetical protein
MKVTYQQMIDRLNSKLSDHKQLTRIVDYTGSMVVLSSGASLVDAEKHRFCKRVMNKKIDLWVNHIDDLLSGKITEEEIKSKLASRGGISCQKKHGDKIKENLNTGTPWNAGTKGKNIGNGMPCAQATKDKISKKNSGEGNGMYGYTYTPAEREEKSRLMKSKVLSGDFTPKSNNRNTHWESTYDGKKYRSSWEALYQHINKQAEYEVLRIEYTISGESKVYIVDFIDRLARLVIEVKPERFCVGESFNAKMTSLNEWATQNGYTVLVATEEWLRGQEVEIDYSRFDVNTEKKLRAFYETNKKN